MTTPLDAGRVRAALDRIAKTDADVRLALARIGYPAPRIRDPGFATLLRIVTAQQLSTRSSAAIWGRLEASLGGTVTAEGFLALGEASLKAIGFSLRKAEYGRAMARAIQDGGLPLDRLAGLEDETIVEALVAMKGFGRWSAEIYLLFALGRVDTFPADDLALQIAYQRLKKLEARPTGKMLRLHVEPWRPWRGAGALFLWHYYGAATLDETR